MMAQRGWPIFTPGTPKIRCCSCVARISIPTLPPRPVFCIARYAMPSHHTAPPNLGYSIFAHHGGCQSAFGLPGTRLRPCAPLRPVSGAPIQALRPVEAPSCASPPRSSIHSSSQFPLLPALDLALVRREKERNQKKVRLLIYDDNFVFAKPPECVFVRGCRRGVL